jgi:hypothetical protein
VAGRAGRDVVAGDDFVVVREGDVLRFLMGRESSSSLSWFMLCEGAGGRLEFKSSLPSLLSGDEG